MGSITLTSPVAGTVVSAGLHAANYALLQTLLNGNIDATNITAASITYAKLNLSAGDIPQSKIAFDAWQAYTPAITGSTGNPTLGSGSVADGRFVQIGKLVTGWARVIVGGAGFVAGTGNVQLTLPVTGANLPAGISIGNGRYYDASATLVYLADVMAISTTVVEFRAHGITALTYAAPAAWAQTDEIYMHVAYEAA